MKKTFERLTKVKILDGLLSLSLAVILVVVLLVEMTTYMYLASLSLGLMTLGILVRKSIRAHQILLVSAVILDLSLVLILESRRDAIDTVTSLNLSYYQLIHVALAVIAVITYIPTLILGYLYAKRREQKFALHLIFGKVAYVFRFLSWIFMFSFLQ